MAAADNNVRPGRRVPAATALGARHFVLARLLLFVFRLAQLDRKLLLLLAALPMSACIIPIGPQFQDPDGRANSPPERIATTPPYGSEVTTEAFSITVRDANEGDTLHARWIADYPDPMGSVTHTFLQPNEPWMVDTGHVHRFEQSVSCIYNLNKDLTSHRIMAIVGDREFTNNPNDLTEVGLGGGRVTGFWIWNVSCPGPLPPGSP